jgi:hypothetical protein
MLWYFFLMEVNHNDRAAVKLAVQGKDGVWLRNYRQVGLGLTDEQFQPIRETAQRLEAELKEIGGKMRTIEIAERAAHPLQPRGSLELLPEPPDWTALNLQRKVVIEGEVSNLKGALGPELTSRLDNYITSQVAPKVTTIQNKEVLP